MDAWPWRKRTLGGSLLKAAEGAVDTSLGHLLDRDFNIRKRKKKPRHETTGEPQGACDGAPPLDGDMRIRPSSIRPIAPFGDLFQTIHLAKS